jgi:peptide deformylase
MTVRLVTTLGDPILRDKARPVEPGEIETEPIQSLVDDLIETMRYYRGAGLAAPQVMTPVRVVAIEVNANPRYPYKPDIPLTVLINPEIETLDDELFDNYEGCLSVPGLRGVTRRLVQIGVRALDRHGRKFEREVRGLSAVTYQHELDHLDGRLFVDLVTDMATLATWEQFERYQLAAFSARATELVARFGA